MIWPKTAVRTGGDGDLRRRDGVFVQLPYQFDVARLRSEVVALPPKAWRRHPGGYEGNTVVPFVSDGGSATDESIGGPRSNRLVDGQHQSHSDRGVVRRRVGRTRLMPIDNRGGRARDRPLRRADDPEVIVPEQHNLPAVMSPTELAGALAELRQFLPHDAAAAALIASCRRFVDGWPALWAIDEAKPTPAYQSIPRNSGRGGT